MWLSMEVGSPRPPRYRVDSPSTSVLAWSGVSGRNSLRKIAMATHPNGLNLKSAGGYCKSRPVPVVCT
jgi:hypothetical protein